MTSYYFLCALGVLGDLGERFFSVLTNLPEDPKIQTEPFPQILTGTAMSRGRNNGCLAKPAKHAKEDSIQAQD
jgi:hypothetical protein